jgi:hypothetical protein
VEAEKDGGEAGDLTMSGGGQALPVFLSYSTSQAEIRDEFQMWANHLIFLASLHPNLPISRKLQEQDRRSTSALSNDKSPCSHNKKFRLITCKSLL